MLTYSQAFSTGLSNHPDLDAHVESYLELVASFELSTKRTLGEFGTVLDVYTTKAGARTGKNVVPVESSIRFQLYGGEEALPAGASP